MCVVRWDALYSDRETRVWCTASESTLVVLVSKNVYRMAVGLASDDMPLPGVLAAGEMRIETGRGRMNEGRPRKEKREKEN